MNFEKNTLVAALALVTGFTYHVSQAATLNAGDVLAITQGVASSTANGTVTSVAGSWFGMDTNADGKIANAEKTVIGQGTTGLVIGVTTSAGASHTGLPTGSDTNAITAPWSFFGNTGSDYVRTAVTGSTTAGLDFSGWTVTWNGIAAINMGGNAWGTGFSSGVANLTWAGADGGAYTLDYAATVPVGDPSGFGNVKYKLHLVGAVKTVAYVAGTSPANNGSLVLGSSPGSADFVVTFSKAVQGVTASNIVISPAATKGTPTIDSACAGTPGQCNIWHFPVTLTAPNSYTVTFSATGVTDVANSYALQTASPSPASVAFTTTTTADVTPPTVVTGAGNQFPLPGATGVTTTPTVMVTFNDNSGGVSVAAGGIKLVLTSNNTQVLCSNFLPNSTNTVYTCTPTAALLPTTSYTVLINRTLVTDGSGNPLTSANNSWAFTTANVPSLTNQSATVAVSGSENVTALNISTTAPGTPPSGITFDDYVSYTLNNVSGAATVTITFPYSIAGKTLYKVNGSTYTDLSTLTMGTNGCALTSRNDSTNTIVMTINDGGACDTDGVTGTITDPIVAGQSSSATVSTGVPASGGAGGGCAMAPSGRFDLSLLVVALGSLGYSAWRRKRG